MTNLYQSYQYNQIQMQIKGKNIQKNQDNKSLKKPFEIGSLKSKKQINNQHDDTIQRIEFYYRYKIISLAKVCKHSINQQLLNKTIIKSNKVIKQPSKQNLIDTLNKHVLLKSKYRHRDKINFRRSPILKVLKYDFEGLRNKMKTKKFQEIYDDLDDDHDEKKEQQKKQFQVDTFFNQQAFNNYRKKNHIPQNQKIFIVKNYDDLTNYMLSRGWVENPDHTSLIYDFKFITKAKQIDTVNLLDHQIINHFQKSNSITTKYGLCRNIKNLVQLNIDCDNFYPRCFDLYDSLEFQDWIEDFKFSKAIAILKAATEITSIQQFNKNKGLILLCLFVSKRYGNPLQQKLKNIQNKYYPIISTEEWSSISGQKKINQNTLNKLNQEYQNLDFQKLHSIIKNQLQRINRYDCQFNLNRSNIWIVKPASRSRGRGIKAFSDLNQILDYIIGKQQIQWVAQKYIQNPLIIKNRKFDIRQWVVLSDLKPLRIWFYNEFYIRFSAEEYNPENIKNRFAHLTNNSIAKYSQNFDNDEIKGNMFFESQFFEYIEKTSDKIQYKVELKKTMQKIVINSLKSVSQLIVPRKNTIELYGYDFMIDQDYKPWLIQVNSSPSMEYSTHVTQKLVRSGLEDFGKLICDYVCNKRIIKQGQAYGKWNLIYNK